MRKTVEIECVGIEDVQEILDDAYAAIREGHYIIVSMHGSKEENDAFVIVSIMVNGRREGGFDYTFTFHLSDNEYDVKSMNDCKSVLKNLLVEE